MWAWSACTEFTSSPSAAKAGRDKDKDKEIISSVAENIVAETIAVLEINLTGQLGNWKRWLTADALTRNRHSGQNVACRPPCSILFNQLRFGVSLLGCHKEK